MVLVPCSPCALPRSSLSFTSETCRPLLAPRINNTTTPPSTTHYITPLKRYIYILSHIFLSEMWTQHLLELRGRRRRRCCPRLRRPPRDRARKVNERRRGCFGGPRVLLLLLAQYGLAYMNENTRRKLDKLSRSGSTIREAQRIQRGGLLFLENVAHCWPHARIQDKNQKYALEKALFQLYIDSKLKKPILKAEFQVR